MRVRGRWGCTGPAARCGNCAGRGEGQLLPSRRPFMLLLKYWQLSGLWLWLRQVGLPTGEWVVRAG